MQTKKKIIELNVIWLVINKNDDFSVSGVLTFQTVGKIGLKTQTADDTVLRSSLQTSTLFFLISPNSVSDHSTGLFGLIIEKNNFKCRQNRCTVYSTHTQKRDVYKRQC